MASKVYLPSDGEKLPLLAPTAQPQMGTPKMIVPRKAVSDKLKPAALDANRNKFQKQSQPRKAIAQFRKKTRQQLPTWAGRVTVHLHVDEIDIEKVTEAFRQRDGWNAIDHFEVCRIWQTEPPYIGHETLGTMSDWPMSDEEAVDNGHIAVDMTTAMPELYLFSFGAAVFWNFPSDEYEKEWMTKHLLEDLSDYCGDSYSDAEIESAQDSISFQYGDKYSIKRDVCVLSTRDSGEKLAVSFALAKSSLLSLYELRVQQVIERNSHIPEAMVQNGRIHMSTREMSREIGRLFLVKHGINLDQSLIDTPEEFWEDDRFEPYYDVTLKYFEISKRLSLVNNRLDMIGELHNKIMEENHTHHAVILEWIIILLIVVEVVLDLLHLGFY
ncbi:hypothetical protein FisN_5Hh361 [Fistulifera solaris]|uniref:DUF155 domain-containing protein n=1 Tax=Fistulifera solaris TaxID=1519565 RepID=A0A1Z5JSZ4_FISSO|nr:hypothetical protein FisN_5Hh361 [Fistulifera solaris]|eukprot:GAX16982.1 hypothetical protein FisN_5Hh361 [Fistulifera solaris]